VSADPVRQIADAVLYEGYMLWPYRSSALKNRRPFTFGDLDPVQRPAVRTQVLLEDGDPDRVQVCARFLQEGVEREEGVGPIVSVEVERLDRGLHRLTVEVRTDGGLFAGTHAILRTPVGAFVSLTDPPERLRDAAAACVNEGLWPVLVGEPGARDTLLASPIILEDHPRIAPESPGDLFDSGEIDGLLALNIMSLTDAEKAEIRAGDPRAREILERTESLTEDQLMRLYGFRVER
jgi:hypothetical protein